MLVIESHLDLLDLLLAEREDYRALWARHYLGMEPPEELSQAFYLWENASELAALNQAAASGQIHSLSPPRGAPKNADYQDSLRRALKNGKGVYGATWSVNDVPNSDSLRHGRRAGNCHGFHCRPGWICGPYQEFTGNARAGSSSGKRVATCSRTPLSGRSGGSFPVQRTTSGNIAFRTDLAVRALQRGEIRPCKSTGAAAGRPCVPTFRPGPEA